MLLSLVRSLVDILVVLLTESLVAYNIVGVGWWRCLVVACMWTPFSVTREPSVLAWLLMVGLPNSLPCTSVSLCGTWWSGGRVRLSWATLGCVLSLRVETPILILSRLPPCFAWFLLFFANSFSCGTASRVHLWLFYVVSGCHRMVGSKIRHGTGDLRACRWTLVWVVLPLLRAIYTRWGKVGDGGAGSAFWWVLVTKSDRPLWMRFSSMIFLLLIGKLIRAVTCSMAEKRSVVLAAFVSNAWRAVGDSSTSGACPWCNRVGHFDHLVWECARSPLLVDRPPKPASGLLWRLGWASCKDNLYCLDYSVWRPIGRKSSAYCSVKLYKFHHFWKMPG